MIPSTLSGYYELHAPIYDLTRWGFLFGRNSLSTHFPELPPGSTILDVGCGTGKQLKQLASHYADSEIFGIDSSKAMLSRVDDFVKGNVNILFGEYAADRFQEQSFDLITCSYSLTMMGNPEHTLSCLARHLKCGGYLLVVDFDDSPFHWFKRWMNTNHVDMYSGLFCELQSGFEAKYLRTQHAYLGLYSYGTFLGQKLSI
ncbi:MAG: class I SAM-dependent methyltransferase [Balneolales bacterium]|nr:class I SAM-dependent methyltransferase [Balneolales bacterium]